MIGFSLSFTHVKHKGQFIDMIAECEWGEFDTDCPGGQGTNGLPHNGSTRRLAVFFGGQWMSMVTSRNSSVFHILQNSH